jgi:hypothetical protein
MDKRKILPHRDTRQGTVEMVDVSDEEGSSLSFNSSGTVVSSRHSPSSWRPPLGLAMISLECPPPRVFLVVDLLFLGSSKGLYGVSGEWWLAHVIRVASYYHRAKGGPNRHKNGLGRSKRAYRPGPFPGWFGPILLPAAHLDILHLAPFICVILRSSSPRSSWGIFMHEVLIFSSRSSGVLHSSTLVLATFGG